MIWLTDFALVIIYNLYLFWVERKWKKRDEKYIWGKKYYSSAQEMFDENVCDKIDEIFLGFMYNYISFLFWVFGALLIYEFVKQKEVFWNNIGEYYDNIVFLSLTLVVGIFTIIGVIISINKSYYISFEIKDIMVQLKVKTKVLCLLIYTLIILVSYIVSPIIENVDYCFFSVIKSLQLFYFIYIVVICGNLCYNLLSIVVSETKFEYKALDLLYRKVWRLKKEEVLDEKRISSEGAMKDFYYLTKKFEHKMQSTVNKVESVKFSSAYIEVKNRMVRITSSLLENFVLTVLIGSINLLLNMNKDMNGKMIVEILAQTLIVYLYSTLIRCCFLPHISVIFWYKRKNFYIKKKRGIMRYFGVRNENRKFHPINNFVFNLQNILSFYKYVLILDLQLENEKKVSDELLEFCILRHQDIRNEKQEKSNKKSREVSNELSAYLIVIMMMFYFQYEFCEGQREAIICKMYNELSKVFEYRELNLGRSDYMLVQWMNALISSINIETKENDITLLRNTTYEKFKEDVINIIKSKNK